MVTARDTDPVYVGIDQSVGGFGLAFYHAATDGRHVQHKKFPLAKYKREVFQLYAVEDWLIEELGIVHDRVAGIGREGYSYGSTQGREKAGALGYAVDRTLLEWLPDEVCFPAVFAPRQVKEFVTGDGAADKEKVKKFVADSWGVILDDDNEADAYGIARMRHALDYPHQYEPWRQDVIERVKNPPKRKGKKKAS